MIDPSRWCRKRAVFCTDPIEWHMNGTGQFCWFHWAYSDFRQNLVCLGIRISISKKNWSEVGSKIFLVKQKLTRRIIPPTQTLKRGSLGSSSRELVANTLLFSHSRFAQMFSNWPCRSSRSCTNGSKLSASLEPVLQRSKRHRINQNRWEESTKYKIKLTSSVKCFV